MHGARILPTGLAAVGSALVFLLPRAAPAQTIPSAEDVRAHQAKGEVFYGDAWVPIERLFQTYLQTRSEMEGVVAKGKDARQKQTEASGELSKIRGEEASKKTPLYREHRDLLAYKARMERIQTLRPPREPNYLREPSRPTHSSWYRDNDDYDRALDRWERERDRIRRENDERKNQWKKLCDELKAAQDRAKKELAETEQKLKETEQKLEDLKKEFTDKAAPFHEQLKGARDEAAGLTRQASSLLGRKALIEKALGEVPERTLWQQGIVEWEGSYHRLADLQSEYDQTQAEIRRVRDDLKAAAEKAGRAFPPDWRHPQQDRMDRLRLALDRANAGRGP